MRAEGLRVGYGPKNEILHGVDIEIPDGELTVIVGPNACGKSTLLKTLARMLPVQSGRVLLDGAPIHALPSKAVARQLGLLPQDPSAPDGIVVTDLVARGRYPHQSLLRQWSPDDERAVSAALRAARVEDLAERRVEELSGGQRQRVWIAMALAQETPILLLDEPTAYLDISHQVEVLKLARGLQRRGFTVVVVLHELNLAFRYATNLVVMREGRIVAQGAVGDVVTPELIHEVYGLPCSIIADPISGRPLVVPVDLDEDLDEAGEGPAAAPVDADAERG
ncbi:ABC transporter ATP-binding protein [Leucobacter weissii]|uniref:ABC transporter ATP-binding protein n=1 Tax=Leucobacter weissii TaxID=1983706 RepID=A0A939MN06_9MICO|nr:ABC transporter ATP-binding protein [Leucobacter weissii]MBO1901567.1 ABC transporter ATP-binding protein [Leucobacter weissii]